MDELSHGQKNTMDILMTGQNNIFYTLEVSWLQYVNNAAVKIKKNLYKAFLSLAQINLSPGLPGPNRIKNINLAISIVPKGYMFKKNSYIYKFCSNYSNYIFWHLAEQLPCDILFSKIPSGSFTWTKLSSSFSVITKMKTPKVSPSNFL